MNDDASGRQPLAWVPDDKAIERRTRISLIDLSREQRITAETMRSVAREACTAAGAMYDSAERMRKAARGAVVEARRQLSGSELPKLR